MALKLIKVKRLFIYNGEEIKTTKFKENQNLKEKKIMVVNLKQVFEEIMNAGLKEVLEDGRAFSTLSKDEQQKRRDLGKVWESIKNENGGDKIFDTINGQILDCFVSDARHRGFVVYQNHGMKMFEPQWREDKKIEFEI